MFEDLDPPNKPKGHMLGQNLENFSVEELEAYIKELEREIARARADIEKKKKSQEAAASVFKT